VGLEKHQLRHEALAVAEWGWETAHGCVVVAAR
jgi:hypothetical protein